MARKPASAGRGTPARPTAEAIVRSYRAWAPVYDWTFGLVSGAARGAAVRRINRQGGLYLDLGVGTGLNLAAYAGTVGVVGVDISPDMLRFAQARAGRAGHRNILGLARMDAGRLAFADGTFDGAAALFVMAGLPDPVAALAELARAVRPGGELVIVNFFSHGTGWRARLEGRLARIAGWFGAGPRFPIGPFLDQPDWTLTTSRRLPPFGLFTMLCLKRGPAAAGGAAGQKPEPAPAGPAG
jgi:phosphatidylethanolamine/phosphatidyl-N-methylethanolamine N-methyltransferase